MSNQNELETGASQIILYKPNDTVHLEVRFEEETVWLTQVQISLLFGVDRTVIGKHLKNIFQSGELHENSTCAKIAHVGNDGKQQYQTKFYNLDAILSVGYRVNMHDRFLLIDNDLYHIGASLKDLGKKLFAFSKMEMTANELLKNI